VLCRRSGRLRPAGEAFSGYPATSASSLSGDIIMKSEISTLARAPRSVERHRSSSALGGSFRQSVSTRIRIVVVDDHPITLTGLQSLLSNERDFTVLAGCSDAQEALRAVRIHKPDVLVIDQDMPVVDGLAMLKQLRSSGDDTPVILLATSNDHKLAEALRFDVEGVVFKHSDPKHLIGCVREVHAGRRWLDSSVRAFNHQPLPGQIPDTLTPRQIEVARAAVSGLSNKQLAQQLGISEGTIKNHLHAIYERLELDGRLALLLYLKEKALA
jgi:two-component system, NarL family, nitrate/nitrite response regulator NarL